jgi:F-type H+-transporting ATPase subunit delta
MSARFTRPYADALVQTADAGFDYDAFLAAGAAVAGALERSRDLRAVLANPAVSLPVREKIVAEIAKRAGMPELGLRWLALLVRKHRILQLEEALSGVREALDERDRVVRARVTAAETLDERGRERIVAALSRRVGATVRATFDVDERLLAGFVARVGSKIFDASALRAVEKFKEEAYGN